jgi:transposase
MLYAGLDLGGQESYLHVVTSKGEKVAGRRLATTPQALTRALGPYLETGLSVAIEAGGSTRWVHDCLLEIGVREVYVVNPNKLRLIAESRKKTDKADARLLADLYRLDGLPEPVHMPSPQARELRMLIKARHSLVEVRTKLTNTVRGFLRGQGVRLPPKWLGTPAHWEPIINDHNLDEATRLVVTSFFESFARLTVSLKEIEAAIKAQRKQDPRIVRLESIPGIGLQSAASLVAAVDDIGRFRSGKQLASYCGLTPTVRNSGEREMTGHINRQGRSEVRRTFVQAAHVLVNSRSHGARPLQRWFEGVRARRGYKTAIVALARRLITICFYLLRDQMEYDPTRLRCYVRG